MTLLAEFDNTDKTEFKKDFLQLMRIASGIDKEYGKSSKSIDKYAPKYKLLVELFNKKYKNLRLKIEKTELRIFINEKNVKDVFSNAANKIEGLKAIGANDFNAANVENSEKFAKELMNVKNDIYISYNTDDIHLKYDEKEGMAQLHYNCEKISDENESGFRLLSYYALKGGYDKSIEIYEKGIEFGFYDLLTETEKDKWLDKFNPRFGE